MALRLGNRRMQQSPTAHLGGPPKKQIERSDIQPCLPRGVSCQARVAQSGTEVVDDDPCLLVRQEGRELAEDIQLEQFRLVIPVR